MSKRETPEKPDFEAMAQEYTLKLFKFSNVDRLNIPLAYKTGAERIWNDYVASKEVEKGAKSG